MSRFFMVHCVDKRSDLELDNVIYGDILRGYQERVH